MIKSLCLVKRPRNPELTVALLAKSYRVGFANVLGEQRRFANRGVTFGEIGLSARLCSMSATLIVSGGAYRTYSMPPRLWLQSHIVSNALRTRLSTGAAGRNQSA
jgi:hypothetical protein